MKKALSLCMALLMVTLCFPVFATGETVTANENGFTNIAFSNGYYGYCIDHKLSGACVGDVFGVSDTSVAKSNVDGSYISQCLKYIFTQHFEELFLADGNGGYVLDNNKKDSTVPSAIYNLSDGDYTWGDGKILSDSAKAYNGPEIPDEGYSIVTSDNKEVTFYFAVFVPKNDGQQSFFAYKIDVKDVDAHECEFGSDWESDGENHWHECECGEKQDEAEHTPTKADCVKGSVCEICEEELGGVDKDNHVGETELRGYKPAGEFEDGYTGDTYCKACDGLIKEGEPIPATHVCEFGTEWESDGENHWHECECGEKQDEAEHTPTKADCVTGSVCEICEEELGGVDKDNHVGETELRGYKPAGEFEDGYTGDTYCKSCDGLIEEGEPIPATHECEFGTEWKSDGENHWHECECGEKKDETEHTPTKADCVTGSVCEVCEEELGGVDKDNHVGETELRGYKPAGEFEDGYTGDTYCKSCDGLIKEGEPIPATHVCEFGTEWKSDGEKHWHECVCGEREAEDEHEPTEADCVTPSVCEICEEELGGVDKGNHTGNEEVRNSKPAEEFEDGYTGDIYCKDCDGLIEEGERIPATHVCEFGEEWESDEEKHWHECVCGEREAEDEHEPTEADCVTPSVCEICEKELGSVDKDNHKGETEVRDAVEPKEFEEGYSGDTYCINCKNIIRQGIVLPPTHECEFGDEWEKDETHHWHECKCGEVTDLAEHNGNPCADCGEFDETKGELSPETGDGMDLYVWCSLAMLVMARCVCEIIGKKKRA